MVKLECFGGVVARDAGGRECALRSRKHLGLLLYLVATPRVIHTREDLAFLLWDGADSRERHSLSQALYDLRVHVGHVVDVSSRTATIRMNTIDCEAASFEHAIQRRDHQLALNLYRGDYASNLVNLGPEGFDRWLDRERARFRLLAALALRNAQREAEERADWDQMCLAALRLIRTNEFDEEAHAALMKGLWMKGDPASALLHAESLLAASPQGPWPLVTALATRIERSGTPAEVLTVPRPPTPLIGRETEFRELLRSVRQPRAGGRLELITGDRGAGKTSLLLELARCIEVDGKQIKWVNRIAEHGLPAEGPKWLPRDRTDTIYFVDIPSGGEGSLEGLAGAISRRDALAFIALGAPFPAHLRSLCGALRISHLSPLSAKKIASLIAGRFRTAPPYALSAAAELCGGNPQLAFEIARVWDGCDGWPLGGETEELARNLLERRNSLTDLIDGWVEELQGCEVELATLLAHVTDACLAVLVDHFEDAERAALHNLQKRGWVICDGTSVRLAHPIVKHALVRRPPVRIDMHRQRLAAALVKGGPAARYAAAVEYERAAGSDAARCIATEVAREALRTGDPALATAASRVAFRTAIKLSDRFDAGLLLAESSLARGSAGQAIRVLRALEGLSPGPAARFDVAVRLGHAAIAEGMVDEAARLLPGDSAAELAGSDAVGKARRLLELAQLRLSIVLSRGGTDAELVNRLDATIRDSRRLAADFPFAWMDAVRSLFAYHIAGRSRLAARDAIARYSDTLAGLGDAGVTLLETCRAVVELKAARLHAAQQILHDVVERRQIADRLRAAALNNLAVTLLESGEFNRATARLAETMAMDGEVDLPNRDRVTPHMNWAQCAFFTGADWDAQGHCMTVVSMARQHGLLAMEAQARAIAGLVALRAGQYEVADREASLAAELVPRLPMDADSYLVDWFLGAANQDRRRDVGDQLLAAASTYETIDRLSWAKLRLLAALMSRSKRSEMEQLAEPVHTLRHGGCGWFIGFLEGRHEAQGQRAPAERRVRRRGSRYRDANR